MRLDTLDNRGFTLFKFVVVVEPCFHRLHCYFIEPTSHFFTVATDEGNTVVVVEQPTRSSHLVKRNIEFLRDEL